MFMTKSLTAEGTFIVIFYCYLIDSSGLSEIADINDFQHRNKKPKFFSHSLFSLYLSKDITNTILLVS